MQLGMCASESLAAVSGFGVYPAWAINNYQSGVGAVGGNTIYTVPGGSTLHILGGYLGAENTDVANSYYALVKAYDGASWITICRVLIGPLDVKNSCKTFVEPVDIPAGNVIQVEDEHANVNSEGGILGYLV